MSEEQPNTGLPQHLSPLLDSLKADPTSAGYYRGLIAPLAAYDREHHGDLVNTLAVYLRHGGNATRTADSLYLHRNSLRYRLARIQVLTGLDPDDPDDRLALQIAIMMRTMDDGRWTMLASGA